MFNSRQNNAKEKQIYESEIQNLYSHSYRHNSRWKIRRQTTVKTLGSIVSIVDKKKMYYKLFNDFTGVSNCFDGRCRSNCLEYETDFSDSTPCCGLKCCM